MDGCVKRVSTYLDLLFVKFQNIQEAFVLIICHLKLAYHVMLFKKAVGSSINK